VDEIGSFMRAYENTIVDIDGNTDSTGSAALNASLSKERAEAVKSYLVQKYSFPPERMRTAGNGSSRPWLITRLRKAARRPPHRY